MGIVLDSLEQDRARAGDGSHPDYEIRVVPAGRHMRINFAGETIASSDGVLVLHETGLQPTEFGIGLHVGDVMYGNTGVRQRLEFTVIGPAANEAARIEDLTKTVGHPIVISSDLALHYPGSLQSLGDHVLRGVERKRRVYTLPDEGS